jgi:hypothetical protein
MFFLVIQGLCALLLGLCIESNSDQVSSSTLYVRDQTDVQNYYISFEVL